VELEAEGFTPIEVIGRGASATVYRAREHAFDREVALKVFDFEFGAAQQQQFSREVRAIGRLAEAHHAIALVFATGVTRRNNPFLSMRYYPGGSLQAAVKQLGHADLADALVVAECIGGALDTAHGAGILHRDVKPANVLLDGRQLAVLTDFGIASFVEAAGDTSTAMSMMTPAYAAPERISGDPATKASDIFSFAATLWSILAGRVPHASTTTDSIAVILQRIIAGDVQPLGRLDVPRSVEEALRRGLQVDPAVRPASAGELVADLRRASESIVASIPFESPAAEASSYLSSPDLVNQPFFDDGVTTMGGTVGLTVISMVDQSPAAGQDGLVTQGEVDKPTIGTSAPPPAPPAPPAVAPLADPSRSRARRWLLAAGGVSLAAALIVGFVIFGGRDTPDASVRVEGASTERTSSPSTTGAGDTTTSNDGAPALDPLAPTTSLGGEPGVTPSTTAGVTASTTKSGASRASGGGKANPGSSGAGANSSGGSGSGSPSPDSPATSSASTTTVAPSAGGSPQPATPASPPPPETIVCSGEAIGVTFSPGLGPLRTAQTMTLASTKAALTRCNDSSQRGITSGTAQDFVLDYGPITCGIETSSGSGTGTIVWSNGMTSQATLRIDLSSTAFVASGNATWTIGSGPFAGSSGVSTVDLGLPADRNPFTCSPAITTGSTLKFNTLVLRP
jgi:serine/threonine protein kinase